MLPGLSSLLHKSKNTSSCAPAIRISCFYEERFYRRGHEFGTPVSSSTCSVNINVRTYVRHSLSILAPNSLQRRLKTDVHIIKFILKSCRDLRTVRGLNKHQSQSSPVLRQLYTLLQTTASRSILILSSPGPFTYKILSHKFIHSRVSQIVFVSTPIFSGLNRA
jgi:hypothetical protein